MLLSSHKTVFTQWGYSSKRRCIMKGSSTSPNERQELVLDGDASY